MGIKGRAKGETIQFVFNQREMGVNFNDKSERVKNNRLAKNSPI
jgi:hypothetical protein